MDLNDIKIRETKVEDFNDIMQVEREAFGYEKEARLVADLLTDKSAEPIVSLLAFYRGQAVGHVLFTRVYFDGRSEQPMIHILAPLAVKPEFQRQGIGGLLIKAGIRLLQEMGSHLVLCWGIRNIIPGTVLCLTRRDWVIRLLILSPMNSAIAGWCSRSALSVLLRVRERLNVPMC